MSVTLYIKPLSHLSHFNLLETFRLGEIYLLETNLTGLNIKRF
jgi:hypothetical protein